MKTIEKLRILYPTWVLTSTFSLLYVPTLTNQAIMSGAGVLGQITTQIIQIAIALLLYKLFEKTDKTQAFLMALLGIMGVPLAIIGTLIPDAIYLASVFWGLWLIPLGTLIIKSKMFPKLIGYLLYISALGYLLKTVFFFLFTSVPIYIDFLTFGELIWVSWIAVIGTKEYSKTKNA